MNTSRKAARALNEKLVGMFFAEDIGFRVVKTTGGQDESVMLKLDRKNPEDNVIEAGGVKIFMDPASAGTLKDCQLDYVTSPQPGFLIKKCRAKSHAQT